MKPYTFEQMIAIITGCKTHLELRVVKERILEDYHKNNYNTLDLFFMNAIMAGQGELINEGSCE